MNIKDWNENMKYTITEGNYNKMGVTADTKKAVFTFECEKENDCKIVLVSKNSDEKIVIPVAEEYCLGSLRSVSVNGIDISKYYYYFDINGNQKNDLYANRIIGRDKWNDRSRYDEEYKVYSSCDTSKFNWENDTHPEISKRDMLIYKMHVRGFSKDFKGLRKKAGTFKGITERIEYIRDLGFTTIELMPIYEFEEIQVPPVTIMPQIIRWKNEIKDLNVPIERAKAPEKINYWGYKKGNYFAVKASYAYAPQKAANEFKELVKSLHTNSMECIMEIFFDRYTNQNLIIDALRYWVREYHVDGFHLMGENLPIEAIVSDVMLTRTKIFYDGFNEISIPKRGKYKTLYKYSDEYIYPSRKILNHMNGSMREFLDQQKKQGTELGYVNYITSNNGFTLADLFMYNDRHNEDNGENNMDGSEWNYSNNYGVEGPTKKKFIDDIRKLKWRNSVSMLFLSQGIPMLWAGDEIGNSQKGNNNAYCQDNKLGWVNWKNDNSTKEKLAFLKGLIDFRKRHPIISNDLPFKMNDYGSFGYPDMSYHGENAWLANWELDKMCVGLMYCGDYSSNKDLNEYVYIGYNFFSGDSKLSLPKLPAGKSWHFVADTTKPEISFSKDLVELENQREIILNQQSICILVGK